ncbi:MAG TPA: O-antigen ligase family protein [Myxococcota bacterium]|nr:O-antigen ligase family protein [Myxococcota bacterium]
MRGFRSIEVVLGAAVVLGLAGLVLTLPATATVAGCVAIIFGVYFFTKPVNALMATFVIRVIIDLFWWVPGDIGGLNILEAFGGGVAAMAAVLCYIEIKRVERTPGFLALCCYLVILVIAAGRSGEVRDAAEILAKYIVPLLLMFLVATMITEDGDRKRLLVLITAAALVSLALSSYHLLSGQALEHYRQGYYRLVGGYKNLHNHALFLLVLNCVLVFWIDNTKGLRRAFVTGCLGVGLVCLYYTYVRTALTGFVVFTFVFLAVQKRWGLVGLGSAALLLLLVMNASMQDRFSDLVTFLGDDALHNRRTLGSGRVGIWGSSMAEFARQSPVDMVLGLGLGGHYEMTDMYADLYRSAEKSDDLDSHNDYLSLLYQLGPIAVVSYIVLQWQVLKQGLFVLRNGASAWGRGYGAFMIALTAVTVVTNLLSNSFIQRVTIAWLFWGMVGILFGMAMGIRRRRLLEEHPRVVPLKEAA